LHNSHIPTHPAKNSLQRRMLAVPLGARLEHSGSLDHGVVVEDLGEELYPNRQSALGESAGNAQRRQAAEVADASDGISERKVGLEVGIERGRGDGLRGRDQHIASLKDSVHFLLQNTANALRADE